MSEAFLLFDSFIHYDYFVQSGKFHSAPKAFQLRSDHSHDQITFRSDCQLYDVLNCFIVKNIIKFTNLPFTLRSVPFRSVSLRSRSNPLLKLLVVQIIVIASFRSDQIECFFTLTRFFVSIKSRFVK